MSSANIISSTKYDMHMAITYSYNLALDCIFAPNKPLYMDLGWYGLTREGYSTYCNSES